MYAYPVLLPAITNREDLLLTLSLFDDDTGDAVELSGRTLARAGDFSGNDWTVTVGTIVTASATELTIPDFPIGNQLEAVALTVAENLAIFPGMAVTIADPTGKNTMTGYVLSYTPATGQLVCQIGFTFDFEISGAGRRSDFDGEYYDEGGGGVEISATLGCGILIIGIGILQIVIAAHRVHRLRRRTYRVGMTVTDSINTRQLVLGELPVQPGGVHGGRGCQRLNRPGFNELP